MSQVILQVSANDYSALWAHLLPQYSSCEEAAFAYAHAEPEKSNVFQIIEWQAIPPEGFTYRSKVGLELTDEMRGSVIKRAHDLGASLVEFHSHRGPWEAKFSPTDRYGFTEFVPHVWWRLKGKPYFSIVVSCSGFDAFVWRISPETPEHLKGLNVERRILTPTMLTPLTLEDIDDE